MVEAHWFVYSDAQNRTLARLYVITNDACGLGAPQQLDPIQLRAACSPRRRFHRERSDTAAGVHTRPWKAERRVVGPSQRPPRRIELDGEYIPSLHHTLRELFRITSSGAYRTTVTRLWLVWDRKRK